MTLFFDFGIKRASGTPGALSICAFCREARRIPGSAVKKPTAATPVTGAFLVTVVLFIASGVS